MLFRFFIILLLVCGVFAQSLFNRIIPEQYYLGDARSMAIGNTSISTGTSSLVVFSNPAKIINLNNTFDIQSALNSKMERRSIVLVDGYESFITESDYVKNQHNYLSHSFGILLVPEKREIAFGFSQAPLYSFNYDYEEEVRADGDVDYGVYADRDPLIGYHILRTSGELVAQSFGVSFKLFESEKNKISFGTSYNKLISERINDKFYEQIFDNSYYEESNIVPSEYINNAYEIKSESFYTNSIQFSFNNIDLFFSTEENVIISTNEKANQIDFPNQIGLPLLLNINEENNLLQFLPKGLYFNKPKKQHFGFAYNNSKITLAFECTMKKWNYDNIQNALKEKVYEYRFGFEYLEIFGFPVRAGLVYSQSQFSIMDPKTIVTLGTGKKFEKVTLDFALNNSNFNYKYYDLFSERSIYNLSCDDAICDKVKENNLILLTTIKVEF